MTETAILAGGCFWGVEEAFRKLPGVIETEVGYTGGSTPDPDYRQVCSERTGHAEALRIRFDPGVITFIEILDVFWRIHDPTQKDRQGPNVGSQYRSAIFYLNEEQRKTAIASRDALGDSRLLAGPVATEITKASEFYPAEDYHQKYYMKRGILSCRR